MIRQPRNTPSIINAWWSIWKYTLTIILKILIILIEMCVKRLRYLTKSHRFDRFIKMLIFILNSFDTIWSQISSDPSWVRYWIRFTVSRFVVKVVNHLLRGIYWNVVRFVRGYRWSLHAECLGVLLSCWHGIVLFSNWSFLPERFGNRRLFLLFFICQFGGSKFCSGSSIPGVFF